MTDMVTPMDAVDQGGSSPVMEGSSVSSPRPVGRSPGGAPVYTYARAPGRPPVSAQRWADTTPDPGVDHAHAHDFLVLVFFERGGGDVRLGRREVPIEGGDVLVLAPGAVIGRPTD